MEHTDARHLKVSSGNSRSIERYDAALELFNGYYGDPLTLIENALAEEPDFMMGHAMRAGLLVTAGDGAVMPMLRQALEQADAHLGRANEREQRHLAAARAWLEGDFCRANRLYGQIVVDYPRDLLAIQVAHLTDFFLGQSSMLRDRVAQVLPHWNAAVPGFSHVLGMHAFGLEETFLYEQAEERGRFALEINARDPWAIHAVAHVMEMQGRTDDGIEWLQARAADWSQDNMMAVHNWWHLTLFHLERCDTERVLALYDERIRSGHSAVALDVIDASAMLWRLCLRGVDVGDRWKELADTWEARGAEGQYAFNDVHAAMAYLGDDRPAAFARLVAAMERAARGSGANAAMSRDVGLPVVEALIAYEARDYDRVIELLGATRLIAQRFGGSHAQRDVLNLTLIEAALRGGNTRLAQALAAERTELKPMNPSLHRLAQRVRALAIEDDLEAAEQRTSPVAAVQRAA
ncbi:tetratricopeptide repeat protein [Cupriavidus sp. AU9028]|uniref:tetratricopeptide repeat protein n=1 Tax=Cupriavidus sp. AU9028 TaxID=2871157 RepID=UPI0021073D32|nr:tetratricopeptide repeat protein [Cupriavidus sp. AU9028]